MSSITNASDGDGDAEISPDAGPKTHHNLSIVYIDHNLDKPIAESTDDEAGDNTTRPNLTVVYIDHHLDGPVSSDTNQGSAQGAVIQNQQGLFRLPAELRHIIWELLLPGKRLLRARASYGWDRTDGSSKIKGCQDRWFFRVYHWNFIDYDGLLMQLKIPEVLTICKESRTVALRHGSFVFGQCDKNRETGTWWNPELDVLCFDHSWDLDLHPWALQHLQGLEHVKNVAIDEAQAWTFCYNAGYNGGHPLGNPHKIHDLLAVTFDFRGPEDTEHYILEFFPHFQQLGIYFSNIYVKKNAGWVATVGNCRQSKLEEDTFSVTFRLGSDIQTAVKELRKYRRLCMKSSVKGPEDTLWDRLTDGPVYSVKNDDVDIDDLDWKAIEFGMCQTDHWHAI